MIWFHRYAKPTLRTLRARVRHLRRSDRGMSTAEYAVGTLAAAALAAVLYVIVTSHTVTALLTGLIQRALTVKT